VAGVDGYRPAPKRSFGGVGRRAPGVLRLGAASGRPPATPMIGSGISS
jgi:hypothetical protein